MLPSLRQSLSNPRDAAARLLAARFPTWLGLQALALLAALGGLLAGLLSGGRLEMPAQGATGEGLVITLSPLAYAALLLLVSTLAAVALTLAGRALGGVGTMAGALAIVAWFQMINLAIQAAIVAMALVLPFLVPLAALASLAALLWCLLGFVQALHGIGPGRALGTILLAALGLGVTLAVLLGLSGLGATTDV